MCRLFVCVVLFLSLIITPVVSSVSDDYDSFDLEYSFDLLEDPMATLYGYFVDNEFSFDEASEAFFAVYEELSKYHRY